jgi:hypothetical protein
MSAKVGLRMWENLYQRLVTGEGYEVIPPSADRIEVALNRFEGTIGLPLPRSYRAWVHQFGPGELGGYFRIYAPAVLDSRHPGYDIEAENANWRDPDGFWASTAAPEVVARLICFSDTIGGDACFWDPADLQDEAGHEYGIYALSHGSMDAKVNRIATTFKEFIESVCLGSGFVQIAGGWGEAGGPPQRFLPGWETRLVAK